MALTQTAPETENTSAAVKPGFLGLVGPIETKRIEEGRWTFSFEVGAQHLNPGGVCHGGMLMTFADHVLGILCWEACGFKPCSTITLNCDFAQAAKQGDLVEGEATITRTTKSLIFVSGTLKCRGNTLLQANGIWKVLGA